MNTTLPTENINIYSSTEKNYIKRLTSLKSQKIDSKAQNTSEFQADNTMLGSLLNQTEITQESDIINCPSLINIGNILKILEDFTSSEKNLEFFEGFTIKELMKNFHNAKQEREQFLKTQNKFDTYLNTLRITIKSKLKHMKKHRLLEL